MAILVDVDGVLADFMTPTFDQLALRTGKSYDHRTITQWQWDRVEDGFLTEEESRIVREIWHNRGFCESIPVYKHTAELIEGLREVGEVLFLTSPMNTPYWYNERVRWILENIEGAGFRDIIFTSRKELVVGDALIDDKVSNVKSWVLFQKKPGIVWAHPYNLREHADLFSDFMVYRTDDAWRAVEIVRRSLSVFRVGGSRD